MWEQSTADAVWAGHEGQLSNKSSTAQPICDTNKGEVDAVSAFSDKDFRSEVDGTRTHDLRIKSPLLYRPELQPQVFMYHLVMSIIIFSFLLLWLLYGNL